MGAEGFLILLMWYYCYTDFGGALPSEISAVYLSMKNSKLECVDECNQQQLSADIYYDDEEVEDLDDFDPYFFVKNLPDLYSVVPKFRPMLLPKQTRSCASTTLVLDLDGKDYFTFLSYVGSLFLPYRGRYVAYI